MNESKTKLKIFKTPKNSEQSERWRVSAHLVGVKADNQPCFWRPVPHRIYRNNENIDVAVQQVVVNIREKNVKYLVVTIADKPQRFVIYLNWKENQPIHWGVVQAKGRHLAEFDNFPYITRTR